MKIERLIIVTPGFASNEEDSTCIPVLQEYVLALNKYHPKLEVDIIALQYPNISIPYSWFGNKVFPCYSKWGKPVKWLNTLALLNKLSSSKCTIHSFWLTEASFMVNIFKKIKSFKWVSTAMGQDVYSSNKYLNWLDFNKTCLTTLSERSSIELKNRGIDQEICIIPFGLQKRTALEVNRDIDVIGVGSLIPLKQWDLFCLVIKKLKSSFPDIKVNLVGNGPEKSKILKLVTDLGLQKNITLLGEQKRPMVLELMNRSKILLHTSSTENQGYIFSEASMMGCYIVSTPVGISSENESWMISDTEIGLTSHIKSILESPFKAPTVSQLNIEETVNSYMKLYEGL